MKLHSLFIIAAAAAATTVTNAALPHTSHPTALGDTIIRQSKPIVIDGDKSYADSVREVMDSFYADQFRHVQDPAAPYFMFLSRNANMAMGLGGEITLRGWYDWNGAMPNGSFTPFNINMHPDATDIRALGATASGTKIFLRAMGTHARMGRYSLYVEGEFSGYGEADFSLKKAYATLNDWTAGLASTTFSDPGALPPTVDRQGPNNKIDASAILVRWMHTWRQHWVMAASVEYPAAVKMENTDFAHKCREWAPDLGFFFQYEWGGAATQHVRLSATTRQFSYRNLVKRQTETNVGWGVQLSSMSNPLPQLTLYATINGGRGIAGLGGDWMMNNYDLTPDPEEHGKMYMPYVMGYMLGVQYNFTPRLFVDLVFSQTHYYPRHQVEADDYKGGTYGSANLFYYITPRFRVGAGFNYGRRLNAGGDARNAYRAGLLAALSF